MALDLPHANVHEICKRLHMYSGMESSYVLCSILVLRTSAFSQLSTGSNPRVSSAFLGQCHMQY